MAVSAGGLFLLFPMSLVPCLQYILWRRVCQGVFLFLLSRLLAADEPVAAGDCATEQHPSHSYNIAGGEG